MSATQPAVQGQWAAPKTGNAVAGCGQEAEQQSQIQQIEQQVATLLKESEIIMNLSREVMEQSHGEAYQEAAQARQQADMMRTSAETVKQELQSARAQSRDGKCHFSNRKLSSMNTEMSVVMRMGNQEKAALEKTVSEYRAAAATSVETLSKSPPSVIKTITSVVKQVTHVSTVAVVGPPVFQVAPAFSLHTALQRATHAATRAADVISHHWNRATNAVVETAHAIVDSPPVMRARALGNAAWQNVQQVGSNIAHGAEELFDASVASVKIATRTIVEKVERVGAAIIERPSIVLTAPVVAVAKASASGAKLVFHAVGEAKDKVADYAKAKLDGAKQFANNLTLWPFAEKAPTALAQAAKPKPAPAPSKLEALSAMARALQQSAVCRLPLGLACQATSPALALAPAIVPNRSDMSGLSMFIGA